MDEITIPMWQYQKDATCRNMLSKLCGQMTAWIPLLEEGKKGVAQTIAESMARSLAETTECLTVPDTIQLTIMHAIGTLPDATLDPDTVTFAFTEREDPTPDIMESRLEAFIALTGGEIIDES